MYREGSKYIIGTAFQVGELSNKVSRKVYNVEEALGQIGGILALVEVLVLMILGPFVSDLLVQKIAEKTKAGMSLGIDFEP